MSNACLESRLFSLSSASKAEEELLRNDVCVKNNNNINTANTNIKMKEEKEKIGKGEKRERGKERREGRRGE